jgi:hypothetical protein
MTADENPASLLLDDPILRFELKRSELAALIGRLVPRETWMGSQAQRVMVETFGDAAIASQVADQITESLIRIHDGNL